jgi:hypothetical protein
LPTFLGGNCTCESRGGDCLRSDVGPWNDYRVLIPNGIEKISDNSATVEEMKEE